MRAKYEQGFSIFPKETIKNLHPLTKLVLAGKKPGALIDQGSLVDCDINYKQYLYRELGLEALPTGVNLAIGKFEKVSDILRKKTLPEIPQIQNEIIQLSDKLKDETTARALVMIDQSPRIKVYVSSYVQRIFDPKTKEKFEVKMGSAMDNKEAPEAAALQGVLLGYKNCCIKYYVETRYFGIPRDEASENIGDEKKTDNPCVLCPKCTHIPKNFKDNSV